MGATPTIYTPTYSSLVCSGDLALLLQKKKEEMCLSLQLAQSSVDFVANLQVQTELFIPGAEMRMAALA